MIEILKKSMKFIASTIFMLLFFFSNLNAEIYKEIKVEGKKTL